MASTSIPQLLVAAGSSGSGKTTFTLGLLRALKYRGLSVQSFKCGPDYIDPKFHELSSGSPSINLDLFMMSPEHVRAVYARHTQEADAVILEGVMGLYDGYVRMHGSSAAVAQAVGIPTVLLVDARSSAYSVGALLYGFKHFRQDTEVVGVVFNRVASENHYRFLREAAEDAGVIPLGYIPKTKLLEVPSRHLGLSLRELQELDALPEDVAALIEKHVDIDRLLEACIRPRPALPAEELQPKPASSGRKIAVARDEAFNFIYEENIRTLSLHGEVSFFSPLKDEPLPKCDLLYIPGGYPEFYLSELAQAERTRSSIAAYAASGGRVLAECGGMMYLCRAIRDEEGKAYPMCGVLDQEATMEGMRLRLGYRKLRLAGCEYRGHEFHYSSIVPQEGGEATVGEQLTARDEVAPTLLYRRGNVLAGYTHLYFAEQDPFALFD